MGASLVYLDRPNTKKNTLSGQIHGNASSIGYKYTCSGMQGWRLNMVSFILHIFQTDKFLYRTRL